MINMKKIYLLTILSILNCYSNKFCQEECVAEITPIEIQITSMSNTEYADYLYYKNINDSLKTTGE